MKAEIKLIGPVRFGSSYELQAEIHCADGLIRTLQWSVHHQPADAVDYMNNFNSHKGEVKKP